MGSAEQEKIKQRRLLQLFRDARTSAERLVIVGDLFDFWFEYGTTIPRRHFPTLCALGRVRAAGIPITYLGEAGLPDPELTETSSMGVFYFTVPDANEDAAPSIKVSGEKPGSVFVSSYFPACPGSCSSAAVIDPYFKQ